MTIAVVSTTLYLDGSLESQRLHILATEKGDNVAIRHTDPSSLPPEVQRIHPSGSLPLLLDKHLILHGSHLIDSYFEERFPAPPLLPTTPIARSKVRFLAEQIKAWYPLVDSDRHQLLHHLDEFAQSIDPASTWFAGDMFTMIDIAAAPLLRITPWLGFTALPKTPIEAYRKRLLSHPSVQATFEHYNPAIYHTRTTTLSMVLH